MVSVKNVEDPISVFIREHLTYTYRVAQLKWSQLTFLLVALFW